MPDHYDVIVSGIGSMGAPTCYELARYGLSVLGLESRSIVNDEASHGGQTRIIRKAYFEHPDYVPLLLSAYRGWAALEQATGKQFYHPVGLAYFGKVDHPLLQSVKNSSDQYNLPLEHLKHQGSKKLLPAFHIPEHYETLLEQGAGFVCTDQVINAYCSLALEYGALLQSYEEALEWRVQEKGVWVRTSKGTYTCDKLVLTSGAGNTQLLSSETAKLKVTRQLISWVKPKNNANLTLGNLPCWVLAPDDEKGIYYGFPMLPASYHGPQGLKVAHHYPGEEMGSLSEVAISLEKQKIQEVMKQYLPGVFDGFIEVTNCLYTYSQDENFIIDFVPDTDNRVIYAAGFSGHGFKFAPVMGEVLRDLAVTGQTAQPIDFLKGSRF